eukprot:scaffold1551_cov164-Ochromonas_danica.AAC.15
MVTDIIKINSFDGQSIWLDHKTELFEVGNFLGGGAAGNVYECEHVGSRERYALKVLNPLGFKITASSMLQKFMVVTKGQVFNDDDKSSVVGKEHVWWLMNAITKQYLACYFGEKAGALKELSLSQCMSIWGTNIPGIGDEAVGMENKTLADSVRNAGALNNIPAYPPKFVEFLRKRDRIFREIRNMRKISAHPNVIRLEAVLELTQDSKCTLFLVMELANGGELFDRIKTDCGTCEDTAKYFFWQLLQGVQHCHNQGVCHRDLKPENLLLQGDGKDAILKIADFGFSAHFGDLLPPSRSSLWASDQQAADDGSLRVLKSVVGSPFYVAPEVLQASGYDGPKADVWSMGVILYAMLAGNLPFGHELANCKRFRQFCKWVKEQTAHGVRFWDDPNIEYPQWLFPARFSPAAKGLIVAMLHPDPAHRISVMESMKHPLVSGQKEMQYKQYLALSHLIQSQPISPLQQYFSPVPVPVPAQAPVLSTNTLPNMTPAFSARSEAKPLVKGFPSVTVAPAAPLSNAIDDSNKFAQSGSLLKSLSSPMEEDGDDEVFRMEEDSPKSRQSSPTMLCPSSSEEKSQPSFSTTPESATIFPSFFGYRGSPNASRKLATPPTPAPPIVPPSYLTEPGLDDLFNETAKDELNDSDSPHSPYSGQSSVGRSVATPVYTQITVNSSVASAAATATLPPFNNRVNRSTRFLTVMPATFILERVEALLNEVISNRTPTGAGNFNFRRVTVDWNKCCLEVWRTEDMQDQVFALQLYQIPPGSSGLGLSCSYSSSSIPCSPDRLSNHLLAAMSPSASPGAWFSSHYTGNTNPAPPPAQELLLVEFIRGQLEIFAFKRFYQFIRRRLSEFVKKDYGFNQFAPGAASPM